MQVFGNKKLTTSHFEDEKQYRRFLELSIKSLEYSRDLEKKGKLLFHGIAVGSSESYWVMNVKDHEEADLLLKGLPVFPYLQIETRPIVSPEHVLREIQDYLRQTKG